MRFAVLLISGLLLGCGAQQLAINPAGRPEVAVNPAGQPVCAVKAGNRQSYWSEETARRDGAMMLLAGECPAPPNSEGGAGGSGGM